MHPGPTHYSTMQVMRRWRSTVIPAHLCIICGGPDEDSGHMRLWCARWKRWRHSCVGAWRCSLRGFPWRTGRWNSWPGRKTAAGGRTSDDGRRPWSPETALCTCAGGSAKSKLLMQDMIQIGEDAYARRNHRRTQIMQLPIQDRRNAVDVFLYLSAGTESPAAAAMKPVRWPLRQPAGGLPRGTAVCIVGVQVVHDVRGGHVLGPPMDGGGGTAL